MNRWAARRLIVCVGAAFVISVSCSAFGQKGINSPGIDFDDSIILNADIEAAASGDFHGFASGAVSADYLVSIESSPYQRKYLHVHSKTGDLLYTANLLHFWTDDNGVGLPGKNFKITFDPHHERFVIAGSASDGRILFGISSSANPQDPWHTYQIADNITFAQEVLIGFSQRWIVLSAHLYEGVGQAPADKEVFAIETSTILEGGAIDYHAFDVHALQAPFEFLPKKIAPARTYDNFDRVFLLGVARHNTNLLLLQLTAALRQFYIDEDPDTGDVVLVPDFEYKVFPWEREPDGSLHPATQQIDTKGTASGPIRATNWNDAIRDVVVINGNLHAVQTVARRVGMTAEGEPGPYRTGVRNYRASIIGEPMQMDINERIIDDTTPVTEPGFHLYSPSIAVNANGDVAIGCLGSSTDHYPSSYLIMRSAPHDADLDENDFVTLLDESVTHFPENGLVQSSSVYFDPVDPNVVWHFGRIAGFKNVDRATVWSWHKYNPEPVTIGFTKTSVLVSEFSESIATANVVMSDSLAENTTIFYRFEDGDQDGSATFGEDYHAIIDGTVRDSLNFGSFFIPKNKTTKPIQFQAVNDDVDESAFPRETTQFVLTEVFESPAQLSETPSIEVRIADDDGQPSIAFERISDVVSEAGVDRSVFLRLDALGGKPYPIMVDFAVTGGTATLNSDYTIEVDGVEIPSGSGTLTFDPFVNVRAIHIVTQDDFVLESHESVIIELSNPVNALPFEVPEQFIFTASIIDDDAEELPAVTFLASSGRLSESETVGRVFVELNKPADTTTTVDYRFINSTATSADYTPTDGATGTLVFEPGETQQSVSFSPIDDEITENNEFFFIELSNFSYCRKGAIPIIAVIIVDDDQDPIEEEIFISLDPEFSQALDEGATGSGVLIPYVASSGNHSGFNVLVSINGATSTAQGGGVDYSFPNVALGFPAGATEAQLVAPINDDDLEEDLEWFDVTLQSTTDNVTVVPSGGAFDRIFILDNDRQRQLQFLTTSGSRMENDDGPALLTVQLSEATGTDVSIDVQVVGGSATESDDFRLLVDSLTFAPGETRADISFDLVDDALFEPNEDIVLELTNPSANAFIGAASTATFTILNDDPSPNPTISFVAFSSGIREDGVVVPQAKGIPSLDIPVTLTEATTGVVTVAFQIIGGTAEEGIDYTISNGASFLTFDPGDTTEFIRVTPLQDDLTEGTETIELRLSTAVSGVLSSDSRHTVLLIDDELDALPQFSQTASFVNEDDGVAPVSVGLPAPAEFDVTVDFAATAGTAEPLADFGAVSGEVTILAGQSEVVLEIPIVDDFQIEDDETVVVTLFTATGGMGSLAPEHVITIVDNDANRFVEFGDDVVESTVEFAGGITIPVVLDGLSEQAISIDYAVMGSATLGSDYTPASGTVTIDAFQQETSFVLQIVNDDVFEYPESVLIVLSNPVNAQLGERTVIEIKIIDDEDRIECPVACAELCDDTPVVSGFAEAVTVLYQFSEAGLNNVDVDNNGLPDIAQARLLDAIVGDPAAVGHCCVKAAWLNNRAAIEQLFPPQKGPNTGDELQRFYAGLLTLGEVSQILFVDERFPGFIQQLPELNFDFGAMPYVSADGDGDLDGECNIGEFYNVNPPEQTDPVSIDDFVAAALDPAVTGNSGLCMDCVVIPMEGMGEGVGEGVGEGMGEGVGEGAGEGIGEGVGEGVGEGMGEGAGEGGGEGMGDGAGEGGGEGVGEGAGEGDGEGAGEASALCDSVAQLEAQLDLFRQIFGITSEDIDLDDIPENYILALMAEVGCNLTGSLSTATQTAFAFNYEQLLAEANLQATDGVREVVAALLLVSTSMQTAIFDIFGMAGAPLANEYVVVECDGASCMPQPAKANGVDVFVNDAKGVVEPYSRDADLDGDGLTNYEEYETVIADGGTPQDYARAASDGLIAGEEPPTGGCGGLTSSRTAANGLTDLLLVLIVMLTLGVQRRAGGRYWRY